MNNKILLTILTSTYNRAKLLNNLYESLRQQTCYNFEWLIIDDGSEDDTKKYIASNCCDEEYVSKYRKLGNDTNFFFKKTVYRVKKNG